MAQFTYKPIAIEAGRRVLEVNVLPEKFCNFDCIFCPIGRSKNKVDEGMTFPEHEESLVDLSERIEASKADLVFINSMGEAFVNDRLGDIIDLIKSKGVSVRLLSNGYLLGREVYRALANRCDEVIGEIKVATETDFQKIQRPIAGYTLDEHISNMVSFNQQYPGKFILEVTIIKGVTDSNESIAFLKKVIKDIAPDQVLFERMNEEPFKSKLGVSDEVFEAIALMLLE